MIAIRVSASRIAVVAVLLCSPFAGAQDKSDSGAAPFADPKFGCMKWKVNPGQEKELDLDCDGSSDLYVNNTSQGTARVIVQKKGDGTFCIRTDLKFKGQIGSGSKPVPSGTDLDVGNRSCATIVADGHTEAHKITELDIGNGSEASVSVKGNKDTDNLVSGPDKVTSLQPTEEGDYEVHGGDVHLNPDTGECEGEVFGPTETINTGKAVE